MTDANGNALDPAEMARMLLQNDDITPGRSTITFDPKLNSLTQGSYVPKFFDGKYKLLDKMLDALERVGADINASNTPLAEALKVDVSGDGKKTPVETGAMAFAVSMEVMPKGESGFSVFDNRLTGAEVRILNDPAQRAMFEEIARQIVGDNYNTDMDTHGSKQSQLLPKLIHDAKAHRHKG